MLYAGDLKMDEDSEKEITKLERYLIKQGRQDFITEMRHGTPLIREAKRLNLAKHLQEIISTQASDKELNEVNAKRSQLRAPYLEQKKMNEKFSRFVHLLAEESGDA